jgi:acetyl-CoA C-acetyltransferase
VKKIQEKNFGAPVFVVDGARTPFLKAKGVGPFSASDLAVQAGQALLKRLPIEPSYIDEVVIGAAMPSPDEANIARLIAMRLSCGEKVPAYTVMRNCASGMQSIDSAAKDIASGRCHLVLAGGTEAMSRAPILYDLTMMDWLGRWMGAKGVTQKAKVLAQLKPNYLVPVFGLLRGLTDPLIGMNMGQTAEELAFRFNIPRQQMDEFSVESHLKLAKAYEEGLMEEVIPVIDSKGNVYTKDTGLRADASLEGMAKLKPVFDKRFGQVTAGNSSQVSDGAAMLLLASEQAVKEYDLPILGEIKDTQWSALDPMYMGLGPVHAVSSLLERHDLTFDDIDTLEINEAFAVQVLACLEAFASKDYCQNVLEHSKAWGAFDLAKLNPQGGAIAAGHPVGASGARIVLHSLMNMKQKGLKRGVASICIGGGLGGAMLLKGGL